MKKKIFLLFVMVFSVMLLTGCTRDKLEYDGSDIKLTFNVTEEYKLVSDSNYYRTAREKAILIGDTFKIGVEINKDLEKEKITFNEFKNKYKDKEDFKSVKYSKMNGFLFYTPEYLRYEIYLSVNDKIVLRLNIYSANDNKKATTTALNSKEVKDILNHMTIEVK